MRYEISSKLCACKPWICSAHCGQAVTASKCMLPSIQAAARLGLIFTPIVLTLQHVAAADTNSAAFDGGGAALIRVSTSLVSQNLFTNNQAGTFGGSVSLQPCIPPTTSTLNIFVGSIQGNPVSTAGCGLSEVRRLDSPCCQCLVWHIFGAVCPGQRDQISCLLVGSQQGL